VVVAVEEEVEDDDDENEQEAAINEAIEAAAEVVREAQFIFGLVVPAPEHMAPEPGSSSSSNTIEILVNQRVKVKVTESNAELKRDLEGLVKSMTKLESKMSTWIRSDHLTVELVERLASSRRQLKRTKQKYAEIAFYDDSDDDDDNFVDVEPDKNAAELAYMAAELEQKPEKPVKVAQKRKAENHKIKLADLAKAEQNEPSNATSRLGTIVVANGVFGACEEAKELPEESSARLSARYYTLDDFALDDDSSPPWSCRARLKNGTLCQRRDRQKCPFHGTIVARDLSGVPSEPSNNTKLPPKTPKLDPLIKPDQKAKKKRPNVKNRLAQKLKLKK